MAQDKGKSVSSENPLKGLASNIIGFFMVNVKSAGEKKMTNIMKRVFDLAFIAAIVLGLIWLAMTGLTGSASGSETSQSLIELPTFASNTTQ